MSAAWRRRLWFIESWLGAAFLAYVGWTHTFGGPEWVHKGLLICAGLGLGCILLEMQRGPKR